MEKHKEPFYVGYMPQTDAALANWLKKYIVLMLLIPILLAIFFVITQKPFAQSVFEFGQVRDFEGVISELPYPSLYVQRPGQTEGAAQSRYFLVAFGKRGAAHAVHGFNGKKVRLHGSLIYRDDQTMIELTKGIELLEEHQPLPGEDPMGQITLKGEIVDSKCFLGVMNPAEAKTHKACAIRCIAGGIPPMLVEHAEPPRYYLLTGKDGKAINQQILDLVAEPVSIQGTLRKVNETLVLETDPTTIQLLN